MSRYFADDWPRNWPHRSPRWTSRRICRVVYRHTLMFEKTPEITQGSLDD